MEKRAANPKSYNREGGAEDGCPSLIQLNEKKNITPRGGMTIAVLIHGCPFCGRTDPAPRLISLKRRWLNYHTPLCVAKVVISFVTPKGLASYITGRHYSVRKFRQLFESSKTRK